MHERWDPSLPGVIVLPGGHRFRVRGLRSGPAEPHVLPELGVYLTARPHAEPGWESRWIRWPDFRLPHSTPDALAVLREAYERADRCRVEIACDGGLGRTGAALGILARYAGVPDDEAVAWVRAHYQPRAVETPWQRHWVARTPVAP